MADTLGFLVQQFYKNLEDQENVPPESQIQLDRMQTNLRPMVFFLIDASKLLHKGKNTVKDSLATLKELIYDVDDILLDCRIGSDASMKWYSDRFQMAPKLKEINRQINLINSQINLKVLDLSKNKLDGVYFEDLFRWIKSQKGLTYLNLRGVAGLKEVPDWIGMLQNLQILILTGCHNLEKLSSKVTTLQNLTVLDIGNCSSLQNLPHGLGKLSNLQELSGFKLAASQGAEGSRLGDLKSLTNLRVLRINIQEEDDIKDEELAFLSDLHHLKVLSVDTKDCENEAIIKQLDQLSPPHYCLEELYLSYYHGNSIPSWITPFNLPQLRYLCIENGPRLKGLRPSFWVSKHKYWKLKGLCLKYLPILEVHWVTVHEMMSSIEYVEVSNCPMLRNFPFNDEYYFWRKKDEEEI